MRLVHHHEVPPHLPQKCLHVLGARELVQPRDAQVVLGEGVARDGRLQEIIREDGEAQAEFAPQLVLPLLREVSGAHDEAAFEVAAGQHLLDEESRHDCLARTRVVGQHTAQRQLGQHILVHGRYLVGQGLDGAGSYGKVGVEEVGEVDTVGLGGELQGVRVGVEGPLGAARSEEVLLLVAVEHRVAQRPGRRAIGQHEHGLSVRLHRHDGHRFLPKRVAVDAHALVNVREAQHGLPAVLPGGDRRCLGPLLQGGESLGVHEHEMLDAVLREVDGLPGLLGEPRELADPALEV